MHAALLLSDGTLLRGRGFGAPTTTSGELVFNTGFVGYEEALTDPSYAGQLLMLTSPMVGNYGVRKGHFESEKIQPRGFLIRELSPAYAHRLGVNDLDQFLRDHNIPGMSEIDTRLLVRKIRSGGVMSAVLCVREEPIDEALLREHLERAQNYDEINFLERVSVREPRYYDACGSMTIALIDTGVKLSIIRNFLRRGVNVWRMPFSASAAQIREKKVDGLFLANGPGNPEQAQSVISLVRELCEELPIGGICLGNQIIALAFGARTFKLPFGHRGINQPVKDLRTGRVSVTSQNHGYAIDEASLEGTRLRVTHRNLNDQSIEGVSHEELPIFSVQMHPEANPGPHDCMMIFDEFVEVMRRA